MPAATPTITAAIDAQVPTAGTNTPIMTESAVSPKPRIVFSSATLTSLEEMNLV